MLSKVKLLISFPFGANFHNNVYQIIAKQFYQMLYKLNCFNSLAKCCDCEQKEKCQYYKSTGKNFHYYPGIVVKQKQFVKNIYADNEELEIEILFIGNNQRFVDYVNIFFREYLGYRLAGYDYQIKRIEKSITEEKTIDINGKGFETVIETENFTEAYNYQVMFYNSMYETDYPLINSEVTVKRSRSIRLGAISLPTRKVNVNGYVYRIEGKCEVSDDLLEAGIGKFNYLGGGKLAS